MMMDIKYLILWSFFGLGWWMCLFTFGVFQTVLWSLIIMAVCGIYIELSEKKA